MKNHYFYNNQICVQDDLTTRCTAENNNNMFDSISIASLYKPNTTISTPVKVKFYKKNYMYTKTDC